MEKKQLQHIFSSPFLLDNWQQVLKTVFSASRLNLQPKEIIIPKNDKADAAFELGNFNTADDRIIGIYQVNVKPDVWLERNKVGLRELLRNVYKYDVDGALVVFVQDEKWRLSFVSEIRTLNETGELVINKTEPKRYTYLLGNGEKTLTPVKRIALLTGKPFTLEDIRNAFSVEALNEEFYKIVAEYFYGLVGAVAGKGKKLVSYDRQLRLPSVADDDIKTYQEFAVRLIGRAVFCWFLKVKKSNEGISLLPEHLLSTDAVKNNPNYYHTVLEKLFFQTLNTPMPERVKGLPEGSEQIPFLNGGLFEPQTDDYYKPNKVTGLSANINTLTIPDQWFLDFFEKLEQYNFTIDENSVVDIEVSVDPEMLGRIFENLLAEIDPESGDTARKATGSFYTPREIVDYMATESLVYYLHNKTGIAKEVLEPIFKMDKDINFNKTDNEKILEALDNLKILDPACGSGAFPMGILQKIVMALQKLDKKADWWKARQISRIENVMLRKQVKEKLDAASIEYARKIGIIQNSLYGVDIQPIAAEISKLRCFLTLVVDESIDETKPNRGVEPLPNLEFKFITADTLAKLPDDSFFGGLYSHSEELKELQKLRLDYLQSYGEQKQQIKEQFKSLQQKIYKDEIKHKNTGDTRAYKISTWNPFNHEKVDWFDPNWMYGVDKFDIVIGNPPYVLLQNTSLSIDEQNSLRKAYRSAQYKTDLYHLFIETGIKLAKPQRGILCYITPNTFLKNKHNDLLREIIIKETHLIKVIRFNVPIFKNASVDNSITITENNKKSEKEIISVIDVSTIPFSIEEKEEKQVSQSSILPKSYLFDFDTDGNEFVSILKKLPHLKEIGRAYFGIQTFDRKKYVSHEKENSDYQPVVDGGNVHRYFLKKSTEYVSFLPKSIKSGGNKDVYQKERILVRQIGKYPEACYCPPGIYTLNTIYNIYTTVDDIYLKYLLAIVNSKLIQAYWLKTSFDNKESFPKIKKEPIESLPIIKPPLKSQKNFVNLVESILFILSVKDSEIINEYVPNNQIIQLFEEVIDSMVYELYFKDYFEEAKIEFAKYVERYFTDITKLNKLEKIEAIKKVYQTLREKNNEIRQNLKLMDTVLGDLIMPIKTAR